MVITSDIKKAICALFEVHADDNGVQRVVTPLEYPGSNDLIVVRVRPSDNGFVIDENGEAGLYATLSGGDVESEAVHRWAEDLALTSPLRFTDDETISVIAPQARLIAPYIFRVAEAAQQLHALATARTERRLNDFKERIAEIVQAVAQNANLAWQSDIELPIAGGLKADHVLEGAEPFIIITATTPTRLLEAEVIYLQYREERKPAYIVAVAENQAAVGKIQFERAAYYTDKTVIYTPGAFQKMIVAGMQRLH